MIVLFIILGIIFGFILKKLLIYFEFKEDISFYVSVFGSIILTYFLLRRLM